MHKKFTLFICLLIGNLLLVYGAKLPETGCFSDQYFEEEEEFEFWQNPYATDFVEDFVPFSEGEIIMTTNAADVCPAATCAANAGTPVPNPALQALVNAGTIDLYTAWVIYIPSSTAGCSAFPCGEVNCPIHSLALNEPVGSMQAILLFAGCYAAFCLYRNRKKLSFLKQS